MRQFYTVTPSFIIKISELARGQNDKFCLELFANIVALNDQILDGSDVDELEKRQMLQKTFPIKPVEEVENNTPDHLRHLKDALDGAIQNEEG